MFGLILMSLGGIIPQTGGNAMPLSILDLMEGTGMSKSTANKDKMLDNLNKVTVIIRILEKVHDNWDWISEFLSNLPW